MLKYAKISDEKTKQCSVGTGDNIEFYQSVGMTEMDVEQAYNGDWYLVGFVPQLTHEEISEMRAEAYRHEVDTITCHIQRLSDEEQTPEVIEEIEQLKQERSEKVEEIKERYPYPEEGEDA